MLFQLPAFTDSFVGADEPLYWITTIYLVVWILGANFFLFNRIRKNTFTKIILFGLGYAFFSAFFALYLGQAIVNAVLRFKIGPTPNEFWGIHFIAVPAFYYLFGASLLGQLFGWISLKSNIQILVPSPIYATIMHLFMPGWGLVLYNRYILTLLVITLESILFISLSEILFGIIAPFFRFTIALIPHLSITLFHAKIVKWSQKNLQ